MSDKFTNNEGAIQDCKAKCDICNFDCCNQDSPLEPIRPESSLLIYPGELEAVTDERRKHIIVTLDNFNGGKLGYCDPNILDQSKCNSEKNYKTLDCQSYPFAPTFKNGKLTLLVDRKRCPLSTEALKMHYKPILERWEDVVKKNPSVKEWIEALNLQEYEEFDNQ